ncbi:Myb/SANT-like domain-containing protein [Tanacetum coccineum]
MLSDLNNQISGSSSNPNNYPGSSTQSPYNQMPYYPNFQSPFASQVEQMLFNQFKMQMQFNQFSQQQQQPNQATASQPQSDQQSYHLVDETEDDNEDEPWLAFEVECEQKQRKGSTSRSQETSSNTKRRGYMERTKNMLTGKWTPMNASVQMFNQLVSETLAHNKHKWKNPESTLARRNRLRVTDEEPEHFGDDALPRPPGLQRIAKNMEQFGVVQVGESKKRRKIRISWKNEKVVKTFLEACIQEVENGTRGGSISWKNISEKLKDSHNFVAEQKQMKNHYDYLKAKYKAWSTLKNKVGKLYDPLTNTFDLTEDQWDIEMKENKYIESLKSAPLAFPKLCARLYDGVLDTEDESGSSFSERSGPSAEPVLLIEGMEQIGESKKQNKVRINWKNERVVKTFLEACIQEVEENGIRGGALHAFPWSKVAEKLKKRHNLIVNQKQMKNHYDYLKTKYKAWSTLKDKVGNLYDPLTNTFNLTDEEWNLEMKGNKYIEPLKNASLVFPKLCAQLYDGVHDTEDENGGSFSERSKSCDEPLLIEDTENINEIQEASTSKQNLSSHTKTQRPQGKIFDPLIKQDPENINETQEASTSKQICSSPAETQRPEGKNIIPPIKQGMEQIGGSKKRKKINWKNERVVKTFLETCIREVEENGPRGGSLRSFSWSKVAEKLKSSHNFIVDQKQMKNHFDYLKAKYKAWSTLKNKVGNLYDPLTNTFDLTDEEWDIEIKGNKYLESLKCASLVFPKLCAQLYDVVLDTEDENRGSFSERSKSCAEPILIKDTENINETEEASMSKEKISSPTETQRPQCEYFIPPIEQGMEQIGESKKRKKIRINWKNERVVKTFLEACIEEVEENGVRGGFSWSKVAEKLKNSHNFIVDKKQMRNHYEYLKAKYKAWSTLKNKVGNLYDPLTNTFDLTDEEWSIEMKGNKYIESLKSAPLVFPKLCARLYDGLLDTEEENDGSFSERSKSCAEPILIEDTENINETQEASTSKHNGSSHTETQRPAKKGKTVQKCNNSSIEEGMSEAIKLIFKGNNGPSFKDCREKLQGIGWGAKNSLHKMALVIFCESATYREAWMDLETDEVEDWVRMIGHKLGLAQILIDAQAQLKFANAFDSGLRGQLR